MPPSASTMSQLDTSFTLRDLVPDDYSPLQWTPIDQSAFLLAQRDALEAFHLAKALRLSQETAAQEERYRRATAVPSSSASTSASARASTTPPPAEKPQSKVDPGSSSASDAARYKPPQIAHYRSSSASAQAHARAQPRLSLSTGVQPQEIPSSSASQAIRRDQQSKREPETAKPASSSSASSSSSSATKSSSPPASSSNTPASTSTAASTSTPESASVPRIHVSDSTSSKRRRTERQPSISNPPSAPKDSLAPPVIDSKKSTASVRLVNPPPTPIEPRPRRRSTASPPATKPAPEPRDVFMATRSCTKCGTPVPSPRSQFLTDITNLSPLLHVSCPKCQTIHCRGCFAVARCNRALVLASAISKSTSTSARSPAPPSPNTCSGGPTCTVQNCCPAVRAIAIFEALSTFDDVFASEADFLTIEQKGTSRSKAKEHRDAYVRQVISGKPTEKHTGGGRRFEDAFVRTVKTVSSWLHAPAIAEGNVNDDDHYPHKGNNTEDRALHASIPRLLASSLMLEVIHVFLANTNVRDWVAHSEAYLAILELLRWMLDASTAAVQTPATPRVSSCSPWADSLTFKSLLRAPIRRIEATNGLRRVVWGDGSVRFEEMSNVAQAPEAAAASTPAGAGSRSLCDLIKNLEAHRRPLNALAANATFDATVNKVNNLCDGILYLLLQQVVDEI